MNPVKQSNTNLDGRPATSETKEDSTPIVATKEDPERSGILATLISPKTSLEALVVFYQREKTKELKDAITGRCLSTVYHIAERIHERLPVDAPSVEELASAGFDGLVDAIDRFEVERGFKFNTLLAPRVRGAILDFIREWDWAPRLVRHRSRVLEEAKDSFYKKNGFRPTRDEIRDFLGFSEEAFAAIEKDGVRVAKVGSIGRKVAHGDADSKEDLTLLATLRDESCGNPEERMVQEELLNEIMSGRSTVEKNFVQLYFLDGIAMKRIADLFNMSESRVSQVISYTLDILRQRYIDLIRSRPDPDAQERLGDLLASAGKQPEEERSTRTYRSTEVTPSNGSLAFKWLEDENPVDSIEPSEVIPREEPSVAPPPEIHLNGSQNGNPRRLDYRWTK